LVPKVPRIGRGRRSCPNACTPFAIIPSWIHRVPQAVQKARRMEPMTTTTRKD